MFSTKVGTKEPDLNSGFPTFATALQDIAGYVPNNVMWFGKWHVSNEFGGANLANGSKGDTLPNYGFNNGRSAEIRWPSNYGSPDGAANEGNNGYLYTPPNTFVGNSAYSFGACDDAIANDFVNNWANNPPTPGKPWFACVSFVNPHDIHYYPGFFPPTESVVAGSQGNPGDVPSNEPGSGYQPQSGNYTTTLFTPPLPGIFNYEATLVLQDKSWDVTATKQDQPNFLQYYFQQEITDADANLLEGSLPHHAPVLAESAYVDFLNWYYYLISLADANLGAVLATAIPGYNNDAFTNPSNNTAIIFLSDHGDYAGSHGLHAKAGAVYDEAIRAPLYVVTPGQSGLVDMFHMCSMVDVFKLVVELALGGQYAWQNDAKYKDQYYNQNQSIFSFIQNQSTAETRGFFDTSVSPSVWYPFILTTTGETFVDPLPWTSPVVYHINCALRNHVMCMRTKSDANVTNFYSAYTGGKLALYGKWVLNPPNYNAPIVDGTLAAGGTIVQDYEYYDYLSYNNRSEVSYLLNGVQTGSDYMPALNGLDGHGVTGSGPGAQHLLTLMTNALGNLQIETSPGPPPAITPASGKVATILTRTLTGVSGGVSLSTYTVDGMTAWYTWLQNLKLCSS